MQRVIITFHLRKAIFTIVVALLLVVLLSVIVVGVGNRGSGTLDNKETVPKFSLNKENINLNKPEAGEQRVKVYMTKSNTVVDMDLEEYIKGVLSAEMPVSFGIEALKAQAVAARTYALSHMKEYEGSQCSIGKGADVCDTVHCQAYMTKEERYAEWPAFKGDEYWNKIVQAVKETEGQVLKYDGELVMEPYYFAISSGKTENAVEVFASGEPYLKSVSSPGEEAAPKYKTSVKYTYSQLANIIYNKYPKSNVSAKKLKGQIKILNRNEGGTVKEIKLGDITISGTDFRSLLDLNSANFSFTFNSNDIQINCIGYGHGVGMSQWGANAMAKSGKNYIEILKHYYQGVEVEKIK